MIVLKERQWLVCSSALSQRKVLRRVDFVGPLAACLLACLLAYRVVEVGVGVGLAAGSEERLALAGAHVRDVLHQMRHGHQSIPAA